MSRPIVVGDPDPMFETLRHRRSWAAIVLGGVLGGLLGTVWLILTPVSFSAAVSLELTQASPQVNISDIGPIPRTISMDTDAQVVRSDAVIEAVVDATGDTPDEVEAGITVSARPLTQIMTITYTSDSAKKALAGSAAAADAFLDERQRLIVEPVDRYLKASSELGLFSGTTIAGRDDLQGDVRSLEPWRQSAVVKRLGLQGAGRVYQAETITAANDRGDVEVPVVSGFAIGAVGTLGLLTLREFRRLRRERRRIPRW